ncbi:hypothetical protein [uncultured Maritimibacter sp.]|uniref:hypothetical protein n=1 Tax=uncultured Maritimibacter sp. TaxID=991866 RepID=UPI002599C1AE|nr:hypothetical protein [uncultured Maritimibacter sp.]
MTDKPKYVIRNRRTGLYWNAGVCDRTDIKEATDFENQERGSVRLYGDEEWTKLGEDDQ